MADLVLDRLEHLADPGDVVWVDGWQLEVLAVDYHAITRLRLAPYRDDDHSEPQSPDP